MDLYYLGHAKKNQNVVSSNIVSYSHVSSYRSNEPLRHMHHTHAKRYFTTHVLHDLVYIRTYSCVTTNANTPLVLQACQL